MTKKPAPPPIHPYPPQLGAIKFQETPEGGIVLQGMIAPNRPKNAPSPVYDMMQLVFSFLDAAKKDAARKISALRKPTKKTAAPAKKGAKRAPNKKRR